MDFVLLRVCVHDVSIHVHVEVVTILSCWMHLCAAPKLVLCVSICICVLKFNFLHFIHTCTDVHVQCNVLWAWQNIQLCVIGSILYWRSTPTCVFSQYKALLHIIIFRKPLCSARALYVKTQQAQPLNMCWREYHEKLNSHLMWSNLTFYIHLKSIVCAVAGTRVSPAVLS